MATGFSGMNCSISASGAEASNRATACEIASVRFPEATNATAIHTPNANSATRDVFMIVPIVRVNVSVAQAMAKRGVEQALTRLAYAAARSDGLPSCTLGHAG